MILEDKIQSQLNQAQNILIITHKKPDADTLGAANALFLFLKSNKKNVTLFNVDNYPENLKFFFFPKKIIIGQENLDLKKFDTVISVDCSELRQTGIDEMLKKRPPNLILINIDHHLTNDHYGDLNLVNPAASSTSEIVFNLLKSCKTKFTKDMTNSLLSGIISDTTYFSNAGTTIESIKIASQLLSHGANLKKITAKIWRNKDIPTLKLWGKIFCRLLFNDQLKIVTAVITQEDLKENNLAMENTEGISNFLTNLYDARVILVLTQADEKTIKGSLRTTDDNTNVAALAQLFGGGGHKKAAGFSIPGKLILEKNRWKIV